MINKMFQRHGSLNQKNAHVNMGPDMHFLINKDVCEVQTLSLSSAELFEYAYSLLEDFFNVYW